MATELFLTLVIAGAISAGIALAAVAMSLVTIEPKLARIGLWLAWVCGAVLCAWYGVTNDMERVWRYGLSAAVVAISFVALMAALEWIRNKEFPPQTVSNSTTDKVLGTFNAPSHPALELISIVRRPSDDQRRKWALWIAVTSPVAIENATVYLTSFKKYTNGTWKSIVPSGVNYQVAWATGTDLWKPHTLLPNVSSSLVVFFGGTDDGKKTRVLN